MLGVNSQLGKSPSQPLRMTVKDMQFQDYAPNSCPRMASFCDQFPLACKRDHITFVGLEFPVQLLFKWQTSPVCFVQLVTCTGYLRGSHLKGLRYRYYIRERMLIKFCDTTSSSPEAGAHI